MKQINANVLATEIRRRMKVAEMYPDNDFRMGELHTCFDLLSYINSLPTEPPTAYVVTRCEEHSDYVEEVFFDKDKAQKYCDQFKGNDDEYARHITKVKVTV